MQLNVRFEEFRSMSTTCTREESNRCRDKNARKDVCSKTFDAREARSVQILLLSWLRPNPICSETLRMCLRLCVQEVDEVRWKGAVVRVIISTRPTPYISGTLTRISSVYSEWCSVTEPSGAKFISSNIHRA